VRQSARLGYTDRSEYVAAENSGWRSRVTTKKKEHTGNGKLGSRLILPLGRPICAHIKTECVPREAGQNPREPMAFGGNSMLNYIEFYGDGFGRDVISAGWSKIEGIEGIEGN